MIAIETVFLGAAIHGIALTFLLSFNAYQNRRANLILAGLVLLLTLAMWNVFAYRSDQPKIPVIIDVYLWATPLLWAPFLYLYTGELTNLRSATLRRILVHALPAIVAAFAQIPLHLARETLAGQLLMDVSYKSVVLFIYPQIAFYFYLCIKDLKTYRASAKQQLSSIEKINLIWLRTLVVLFSAVLACDMALNIPAIFFGIARPAFYDAVILAEAATVFVIGYLSLRQPEILAGQSIDQPEDTPGAAEKYLGSPVDETLGVELAEKLDKLMDESEIFLSNGLTLKELAKQTGLSPHHLSQVINQHRHRNFYDYVNGYRAKYAAKHLRTHGKTNLTKLAFDCGFNNRVSFFQAFKKYTGQTPTNFVKTSDAKEKT